MRCRSRTAGLPSTSASSSADRGEGAQAGRRRPAVSIVAGDKLIAGLVKGSLATLAGFAALDQPSPLDKEFPCDQPLHCSPGNAQAAVDGDDREGQIAPLDRSVDG